MEHSAARNKLEMEKLWQYPQGQTGHTGQPGRRGKVLCQVFTDRALVMSLPGQMMSLVSVPNPDIILYVGVTLGGSVS